MIPFRLVQEFHILLSVKVLVEIVLSKGAVLCSEHKTRLNLVLCFVGSFKISFCLPQSFTLPLIAYLSVNQSYKLYMNHALN